MSELHKLREYYEDADHKTISSISFFDAIRYERKEYTNVTAFRLRGLVRDMMEPEWIKHGTIDSKDEVHEHEVQESRSLFSERTLLRIELYPFATAWARQVYWGPVGDKWADRKKVVHMYVHEKLMEKEAFKINSGYDFVAILDPEEQEKDLNASKTEDSLVLSAWNSSMEVVRVLEGAILHCSTAVSLDPIALVLPHKERAFYQQLRENSSAELHDQWKLMRVGSVSLTQMREKLVTYIARSLLHDRLAAEYYLLCLLSRVYAYADADTSNPLGNISLNIRLGHERSDVEVRNFVKAFESTTALLVPLLSTLHLSIERLNTDRYSPAKDYGTETLLPGKLQLPNGTVLLIDETTMTTGALKEQGTRNLSMLGSLLENMQLLYDFQYYDLKFPQDVVMVSISKAKSILPFMISIPLHSNEQAKGCMDVSEAFLRCFRLYLAILRTTECQCGNEVADMAERYFVSQRKENPSISSDDLDRWLRLSRLQAISKGEHCISSESWQEILELESQRSKR